jgi:hypothetical protein
MREKPQFDHKNPQILAVSKQRLGYAGIALACIGVSNHMIGPNRILPAALKGSGRMDVQPMDMRQ